MCAHIFTRLFLYTQTYIYVYIYLYYCALQDVILEHMAEYHHSEYHSGLPEQDRERLKQAWGLDTSLLHGIHGWLCTGGLGQE